MIIRSKAPLRLGLAGGGTDVSPYSDLYGGAILNATINLYAYATIKPLDNGTVRIHAVDRNEEINLDSAEQLPIDGKLDLVKGVYNRIVRDFAQKPLSFEITTYVDAPPGSGLGSSSTLVVAIVGAFVEWLKLPMGEYDIAHLAYSIEREDLKMQGGKQDQYAATFGGVNFMEFYAGDKVIVNPLRIKDKWLHELENNLVLYYTETSRLSSEIIKKQADNVTAKNEKSIEAMHSLKEQSQMMKEAILRGEVDKIGEILHYGWKHKKDMAAGISNDSIDKLYNLALEAGATGGKISGAGGGGFMIFYAPYNGKFALTNKLNELGGRVMKYSFTNHGLTTWTI
jgi:D-glycero-alpha-D-manno-heptose-7-phosphate kinase